MSFFTFAAVVATLLNGNSLIMHSYSADQFRHLIFFATGCVYLGMIAERKWSK